MRAPSERALQIAFAALALVHLALGAWMVVSPHSFFLTLGAFQRYNPHYERDAATFELAFAFGAWIAVRRPGWRIPVLAVITVQYALHSLNHAFDVNRANNAWAGPVDVASLGLATLQFAALLWLLTRADRPQRMNEPAGMART